MSKSAGKPRVDLWFIAVLALSLIVAFCIAIFYVPRANVTWDEAHYLVYAYNIAHAVRTANPGQFWAATREQFIFPPFHSWVLGIPLAYIGFSVQKARIIGLSFIVLSAVGLYILGKLTDQRRGHIVGCIAGAIFLTSPLMLLYGSLALKELLGVTVSIYTVILYDIARKKQLWYWDLLVALALWVGLITKYNFGLLVAAGIGLEGLVAVLTVKHKRAVILHHLVMALPPIVCLIWWIYLPVHSLEPFIANLKNSYLDYTSQFAKPGSLNQLLFYPRAILYGYSVSVWVGAMLLASIVGVIPYLKNRIVRISWMIFLLNLIYGTIHANALLERYILTTIPFLYIVGAYMVVKVAGWILVYRKSTVLLYVGTGVGILASIFIFLDILKLKTYVYAVGTYVSHDVLFNQRDYQDLWFDYDRTKWTANVPTVPFEKPEDVITYILSITGPYVPLWVIGHASSFSPWYVELLQDMEKEHGVPSARDNLSYLALVKILPSSRFYTRDYQIYNATHPGDVPLALPDSTYTLVAQKHFAELNIDVEVYSKPR